MLKKSLILITCITPTLSYSMGWLSSLWGGGAATSSSSSTSLTPAQIQTGIDPQSICHPLQPQQYTAIMLERARVAKELYPYQTHKCFTHPNEEADNKILSLINWIPQPTDSRYAQWKQDIVGAATAGGNTNTNLSWMKVGQDSTGNDLYVKVPQAIALEGYAHNTRVTYNPTPPVNRPLSAAVRYGEIEFVKFLLQHGALANATDIHEEYGPFTSATTVEIVQLLVDNGGQPKYFFYRFRHNPLHSVVKKEYEAKLIPLYASLGVNPNQQGGEGKNTPLHDLIDTTRDLNYPFEQILEKAQLLLTAGANNKTVNGHDETPSKYAQRTATIVSPEAKQRCEQLKTLIETHR